MSAAAVDHLRAAARRLLEEGTVHVVIGYTEGSAGRVRPAFIRRADDAAALVLDERCRLNLAVYLPKPEIRALGKPAVVALPATLRALLQSAAEHQWTEGRLVALAPAADGSVAALSTFAELEAAVAAAWPEPTAAERDELERIMALPREERWRFWQEQLARCVKCYACRAACPLCYCPRCVVDANQPQWVPAAPHVLGNLEWHVVRAMHLAGRCADCGACAAACPVGIPLHLLNRFAAEEIRRQFGSRSGESARSEFSLSTFSPEDRDGFIG